MALCAATVLFVALPALAGGRASLGDGPAFASHQQASVLARVGDSVALRCRVLRLADRAVSWVRSADLQILTHAGIVFTADSRVSCDQNGWDSEDVAAGADDIIDSNEDDWGPSGAVHTLRIDKLRLSDAGRYECQINTEPKLSSFFNLTVIEDAVPTVSVQALGGRAGGAGGGPPSAALGGSARLACEARYESATLTGDALAALPPLRIRWEHNGVTLDPQSSRGGISMDTERWSGRVVSRLTLAHLEVTDSGRYTCIAGDQRAYHVLRVDGDEMQDYDIGGELDAMQRDQAAARMSAATRSGAAALLLGSLLTLLLLFLT